MATKKTTSKKAPAKKKATVTSKKKASSAKAKAFKPIAIQPEKEDFMTFRVNRETFYWVILGVVVILFTAWLMDLQADIQKLYDQVDLTNAQSL